MLKCNSTNLHLTLFITFTEQKRNLTHKQSTFIYLNFIKTLHYETVFIVIITRLNHLPHPNFRPGTVKLSGTVKNAQGKTDASRYIVLDKGSITLDEVEVTASNVIVGDNITIPLHTHQR